MGAEVNSSAIAPGMAVYGMDGELLGPVESVQATNIRVLHHTSPAEAIARVDENGVHLLPTRGAQIIVPLAEERLMVGTREVDLGEVFIRKRVVEEMRLVPVTYRREEVAIVRREAGQPWPAGVDEAQPGVAITRIPLRAEEPLLTVQPIVAREVVIEKVRVAEARQITDTVRCLRAEVEERYR